MSALLLFVATLSNAQSYPDHVSTKVNDFADLLSPEAEARVAAQISALKSETDVEMTVVTLSRRAMFTDSQSLEEFATGLFNNWGIGDKTRNDGILVLVLRTDREMRVELGKAYGHDWDRVAEMVVDRAFLPLFKKERYEEGVEKGVNDIIATIAHPFHKREPVPDTSSGGISGWWAALIGIPLVLLMFLRKIKDKIAERRPCPKCGKRALHIDRKTVKSASTKEAGSGEKTTSCSSCSYRLVAPYSISRRTRSSSSSSSGFGGGSSGGGGASGRW